MTAAQLIENAETALQSHLDKNDGPLWGDKEEREYQRLAARLEALYFQFDTPEDDRMYC